MTGLAKTASESGVSGLQIFYALDFAEQLILESFLKSCGFCGFQNISAVFSCRLGDLRQSAYFKKYASMSKRFSGLVSFRDLSQEQLDHMSLRHSTEIPAYLHINATGFDRDISFAAVGVSGIEGYILACENNDIIEIVTAIVFGSASTVSGAFPALVSACLNAISDRYEDDKRISVDSINNTVTGMARNYTAGIPHRVIQGKEAFLPLATT